VRPHSDKVGLIIGLCVGLGLLLLVIIIIAVLVVCCMRRKKQTEERAQRNVVFATGNDRGQRPYVELEEDNRSYGANPAAASGLDPNPAYNSTPPSYSSLQKKDAH